MAVLSFRPFSSTIGLISGTKLNRLFQGNEQMQSINVSGAAAVGGTLTASGAMNVTGLATFSGGESITGARSAALVTVKATGATAGTARAIAATAFLVTVTATASTEGVKLPTAATGRQVWVFASPTIGCKVYGGAAGQKIGAGTTNTTAYSIPKATATLFVGQNATQWLTSGHAT